MPFPKSISSIKSRIIFLTSSIIALFFIARTSIAQTFSDVSEEMGINTIVYSDYLGNGISFYDFNNDGWDDISIPTVNNSNDFFINDGGNFGPVSFGIDNFGQTKQLLWVDYDNDGDLDIFKSTFNGTYQLYENNGDFEFTDVSADAGLAQTTGKNYGACFGDYDRDGYLDLYVCKYDNDDVPYDYDNLNKLYHNNGDGTFTDVTLEAGVEDGFKFSFQAIWFDYNNDNWPDLYVINDRVYTNSLYKNNGDGTFEDVSVEANMDFPEQEVMSVSSTDFDNDGDLDIFMTNSTLADFHTLLAVNNGDGTFTEMAMEYNAAIQVWSWGATWVDFNNDGYQDIYFTSGLVNNPPQTNYLLGNLFGNSFSNANEVFMDSQTTQSFSTARGDFDNNGYYDLVVNNRAPVTPYLWRNSGGDAHFIKITLEGTVSNHYAIGSWIKVYSGGISNNQYTFCGENYVSQNSQHHIFGLADQTVVDSVEIQYNSGHVDKYYDLEADTSYHFIEGETFQPEVSYEGDLSICEGDSIELDAGQYSTYLWNTGETTRFISVNAPGQYSVAVTNQFGITSYDTVNVSVNESPSVIEDFTDPPCAGVPEGSIVLDGPDDNPVIIWDGDFQGDSLTALPPGMYNYIYIDEFGCQTSGSITLQDPPPLKIKYSSQDADDGDNGEITVTISGGNAPYEVFLNGEPTSMQIDSLSSGVYQINVVDDNGCEWEEEIAIQDVSSTHKPLQNSYVRVYPNPSGGAVLIENARFIESIRVIDVSGQTIIEKSPSITGRMSFDNLPSGAYILQLTRQNGRMLYERLVIR